MKSIISYVKPYLTILLYIVLCSCKNEQKSAVSTTSGTQPNLADMKRLHELVLVRPENISLEYELDKNYEDTSLGKWGKLDDQSSRLTCTITNNNDFPVFLVGYSCSDLPGVLEIFPDDFYDWQVLNCNVSWPMIHQIDGHQSKVFHTNLREEKQSKIDRFGMYVKFVNRWEDFDTLKEYPERTKLVLEAPYEKCSFLKAEN